MKPIKKDIAKVFVMPFYYTLLEWSQGKTMKFTKKEFKKYKKLKKQTEDMEQTAIKNEEKT